MTHTHPTTSHWLAVAATTGLLIAALARPAVAQTPAAPEDDPDLDISLTQPDFTLSTLPTTLRLPRHRSAFRVTHRFGRPLGQGDFGSLVEDLFGLDSGALVGLEYRFGIGRGLQAGLYRTSDRTIQLSINQSIRQQRDGAPVGLALLASVDGTNNFRDEYRPGVLLIVSREIGTRAALYLEPGFVANTNPLPKDDADDNHTVVLGVGARLRVRSTVYLVLEATPRLTGFAPGAHQGSIGLEKRAGGHSFQLNVANGFGTTLGQVARGGLSREDWFIGFNITRKFF